MKEITKNYFVSSQVAIKDIDHFKKEGFEVIVCNRPNNEEPNQPNFESISKECKRLGIEFYNFPLSPGELNLARIQETKKIIEDGKKTLAYCRTGTRCITLWACAEIQNQEVNEILKLSAKVGYDLNHLEEIFTSLKSAS